MDTYRTLSAPSSARYTVKMSRFLAFAYPVASEEEAKALIRKVANNYHDARHVCWAYMLGHDRSRYQSSDNGEPSGTAGKPILGQVNSLELTDVLVLVVSSSAPAASSTPTAPPPAWHSTRRQWRSATPRPRSRLPVRTSA